MKDNFQKYYQAVKYLESLNRLPQEDYLVKKNGRQIFLKRLKYFLKLLGNPQQNLKYIHVGGTSGKGSVAAMIQSILTEAGFRAGLFTSPFCTTSIEKIKVGNLLISSAEFTKIVDELKPKIDLCYQKSPFGRPSYFEVFVAIALIYFKQKKCDYAVLEVGLGGRFDATNIIPTPTITVINVVDYDHTEILGKTLTAIAKEKAAIIKPKTIFFTPSQNTKVLKILKTFCQKNQAEFNLVSETDYHYSTNLLGSHQQKNAALATAVCQKLKINETKIRLCLKKVKLPCRLEIIRRKPLVILDGAHNISKMKTTAEFINNLTNSTSSGSTRSGIKELTYQKLYLIIGLTNQRSPSQIFGQIKNLADYIFVTRYQSNAKRCYPPKKLAKKLKAKKPTRIFLDAELALKEAIKKAKGNDLILVSCSLYLAGEIRNTWRSESAILKERKI